jgi:D-alanyl-D-alanine dipeptidase
MTGRDADVKARSSGQPLVMYTVYKPQKPRQIFFNKNTNMVQDGFEMVASDQNCADLSPV